MSMWLFKYRDSLKTLFKDLQLVVKALTWTSGIHTGNPGIQHSEESHPGFQFLSMIKNDKKMKKTESIPSFSDELGNKADEKEINAAN